MSCELMVVCAVQLGENLCLYFADDDELECDAFSKEKTLHRFLRNVNSQVLVVQPDLNMAAFEDVTDQEMKSGSGMNFCMHCYKTTTPSAGMPVAFSVRVEDKSYYMCCEEEHGKMIVRFREGEVPKDIPGESNIIFFKKTFTSYSSKAFKFEYSLERGMFLAFEEEDSLRKLILKKLPREDEVDETTKITLTSHNERPGTWSNKHVVVLHYDHVPRVFINSDYTVAFSRSTEVETTDNFYWKLTRIFD